MYSFLLGDGGEGGRDQRRGCLISVYICVCVCIGKYLFTYITIYYLLEDHERDPEEEGEDGGERELVANRAHALLQERERE